MMTATCANDIQCIRIHDAIRYRSSSRRTLCRDRCVSPLNLRQLPFPDILIGEVLKLTASRDAQAKRGEEVIDPERFQDPDDERNLFAGTVYEADDEEADRIWDSVEERMDARRRARRCVKLFYQR
jgi:hypothetical protein